MEAASKVAIVSASNATTATVIHTSPASFNVNHNNNNNNVHTHINTHSGSNSLMNKITNNSINIGGSSNSSSNSNSNSSCSSSSTSSNSSGYGSTTTTPTNNYDLQQTTPTTTPIPTTPGAIAEHIIPVATVAAVAPFYNESITAHNLQTHHVQHHHHQQQPQQQQQHPFLQTSHHKFSPTNLQHQQHHQYLSRQQYYSPYDYQQTTTPTHNISGTSETPAVAPYNMIIPGPYELSSSPATLSYSAGQYKASNSTSVTNYDGSTGAKSNIAATTYNQQQQQHGEHHQPKVVNQQHFTSFLSSSKQRSSSALISNTANSNSNSNSNSNTNTNTSKPQATATPFYANPTPFYDNFKHKISLEYNDTYGSASPSIATTYQQQQKYYAAAKSQLKEVSYGSQTGINGKPLYPNTGHFYPAPSTGGLNLSSASYDKYMYPHTPPTGYPISGHLGNEQNSTEVSNYRKPVTGNAMSAPCWPWGIDYTSGNSRSIPPPASHLPTATVAPTHSTHLAQNSSVLTRDPYYMGHDKYGVKYDKYTAPPYQQSYVSPPASRHIWPNTPHTSNLTQLNERHLLATSPPALPSHNLHAAPYFPNNSSTGLNSRQSCCSQPYQPQNCYYPPTHPVPPRLPHSQTSMVAPSAGSYLPAQQTLGQSPHLNALSASCKYGGVLADYGSGNKLKSSSDLYLNSHQYDNNTGAHNFGYGSGHSSQQLYATNAHQSLAHESTPASMLTNDPLNANSSSYTNDLGLTSSNFDSYHSHLETIHSSQQALTGIHNQQPPPAYGPTVAKRALLDYRKPIQPQPPPAIAEDCYTTLTSRDHYIQHELLNTPETTTVFGEYENHQSNTTGVLADSSTVREESNKNVSLRDFIANWNDDEEEYQNNEEVTFDQATVIDEVLQTVPVIQEVATVAVAEANVIEPSVLLHNVNDNLKESVKVVGSLATTLNDPDANQYVNLPDIVIDIEKSNNINSSIVTPTTSPPPSPIDEANNRSLSLATFDVEKELDELNLKKPAQHELTKDLCNVKDSKTIITSQLSPCRNLTNQLSFEDLNLEPANKTVLITTKTRLTTNHNSELNEHTSKDVEGYESSSSHHSNESAFEKEYETFINKITSETSGNKICKEKMDHVDKETDFVQNVHDFSKFYKRKRKLKENELKLAVQVAQHNKKLKTTETAEVDHSNFPQVYTKKSRNRLKKFKLHCPHRRKPISAFYKIIHSIRRFGLYRHKRVHICMTELKEKHLPLIKRQSIKNYTHEIGQTLFNAKSLQALCIVAINTDEFRESLMVTMIQEQENCIESEEKHICIDPACETCDVIKSLMEAESFETTLMQHAIGNTDGSTPLSTTALCAESNESMTILQDAPNIVDINYRKAEHTNLLITSEIENMQYSKENLPALNICTKDLDKDLFNSTNIDFLKTETNNGLESCYIRSKSTDDETDNTTACGEFGTRHEPIDAADFEHDQTSNVAATKKLENIYSVEDISSECNMILNKTSSTETQKTADPLTNEKLSLTKQDLESGSETSDSSSDTDSTSSDTEDDAIENSKDSCRKSNTGNRNESNTSDSETCTDTDTDTGTDTVDSDEDSAVSSDSKQSHHSEDIKTTKNLSNREENDILKTGNESNMQQLSPATAENERHDVSVNDIETEPTDAIERNKQSELHTDSESEEEHISQSPQRIVIRITKSLSPNDRSLRVENVFGKSLNETKSEEISKAKTENETNMLKESIPENALNTQTNSKMEDISDTTKSAPLKLILKRRGTIKEQSAERKSPTPYTDSDSNSESEYEDDDHDKDISDINSETDTVALSLSPKEECSYEKSVEPFNKSELKEMNISGEKFIITSSLILSQSKEINGKYDKNVAIEYKAKDEDTAKIPILEESVESHSKFEHPENASEIKSDCSEENSLESLAESDLENIISEKNLEIKSTPLEFCSMKESFERSQVFEKYVEPHVNKECESEDEDDTSKTILTSSLKSIAEDVKETSKSIIDLGNSSKNQTDDLDDKLETKSNAAMNSLGETNPKTSEVILNGLEKNEENIAEEFYETAKISPKISRHTKSESESESEKEEADSTSLSSFEMNQCPDDLKKETFSKESVEADIETYSITDNETENEEEEESDNDINSQNDDNQERNISDCESIYDAEDEADDNDELSETLERLTKYDSKSILISDDDSMHNEELLQPFTPPQKFCYNSDNDLLDAVVLDAVKDNGILNKTLTCFAEKDLDSSSDLDFKIREKCKDKNKPLTVDRSEEEDEFPDSERNIVQSISENTNISQENNVINIKEYPEDFFNSPQLAANPIIDHISLQSPKNSETNCNNIKCDKNINDKDIALEFSSNAETSDCDLDSSEKSKLPIHSSYAEDNVLQDIEPLTADSEKDGVQQIHPEKTAAEESKTNEPVFKAEIENSNISAESSNKLCNSENIIKQTVMVPLELDSARPSPVKSIWNISEENKSIAEELNEVVTEHQRREMKESNVVEDTKDPLPQSGDRIAEQKSHIVEVSITKELSIEEVAGEDVETEEKLAIAQNTTNETDIDFQVAPQEANLLNSEELNGEENLLKTSYHKASPRLDFKRKPQFTNNSVIEECETIFKAITEEVKENIGDSKIQESVTAGLTTEEVEESEVYFESSNKLQTSDAKSGDIYPSGSENISEAVSEKSSDLDKIDGVEKYEQISSENDNITENIAKKSETILQNILEEPKSTRPADILSESIENIAKIDKQNLVMLENLENLFHNAAAVNGDVTIEASVSKPISKDTEGTKSQLEVGENSTRKITTVLKGTSDISEQTPEIPNEMFEKRSESTEEFVPTSEATKGEILEKTAGQEELKFTECLAVSTLLAENIEKDENELISQKNENSVSHDAPEVSHQIEYLAERMSESKAESSESLKLQNQESTESNNDDEEFQIEIQTILSSKSSNNLKEAKASKAEEEISLDKTVVVADPKEKLKVDRQTLSTNEKLVFINAQANEESNAQHQTESFKRNLHKTSSENVSIVNFTTYEDLSGDFFGFKHQCSFEDESGDFHGFEDLEEVARIRKEIENLDDDSTANDGFLNEITLDRQMHGSSASSLTESTSSELNEFEALEKELSQPQQEMPTEDEDKEIVKDLPTKSIEIVSSNDIEHIKKMLESDEELHTDGEDKKERPAAHKCIDKSLDSSKNSSRDIVSSVNSLIRVPKLSDLCRAALNTSRSLSSNSNLAQQHTDAATILVERELSVEEALAEMYHQAGVLLSDPEEWDNDIPSPSGDTEAHDVLLINLQEILNSDNNEVYVLQCDMDENVLNVVQSTEEHKDDRQCNEVANTERVNTVQIIVDTKNTEQQIHIISSDSESEVVVLSDEDSNISCTPPPLEHQERVMIPFINDDDDINYSDNLFDIPTIHHEEIVPDNLKKFLQEEFYKYLHEKYVQRNISKYYHANRVLKKYKRIFLRTNRQ